MKTRFNTLDVFRGFAAILVAIYHFSENGGTLKNIPLIANGNRCVDFFFVLSGFIIYHNYPNIKSKEQTLTFIIKRIIRLYPLHLFMLLIFLLFEIAKAGLFEFGIFRTPAFTTNSLPSFIQNIFMLQGLVHNSREFTWNYPSWSISTEFFAYLTFASVILPINRLRGYYRATAFIVVAGLSIGILLIGPGYFNLILNCVFGFFLGCSIDRVYKNILHKRVGMTIFTILELLIISITLFAFCYLPSAYLLLLSPLYAILILIFALEKGLISRLITNRITIWLGMLSYSIYMTHALVASVMRLFLTVLKANNTLYNMSTVFFVVIVIFISYFTHRYVEVKGGNILRFFIHRKSLFKSKLQFNS